MLNPLISITSSNMLFFNRQIFHYSTLPSFFPSILFSCFLLSSLHSTHACLPSLHPAFTLLLQQSVSARLGRVCRDDPGGERGHADRWTSFLKANLECSVPGQPTPFRYTHLVSVAYLPTEDTFYTLFNTHP